YMQFNGHTEMPLQLPGGGSIFVVFSKDSSAPMQKERKTLGRLPVRGEWILSFPPGLGAPASITQSKLQPWNRSDDPGVRYFSGTATYTTTVSLPDNWKNPGERIVVDLGEVRDIAEVIINSKSAGFRWAPPYQFDITDAI